MPESTPAELIRSLESTAREIRQEVIRMTYAAQSGHPGGSLSVTDLVTALVFHELKIDPARIDWPDRDRLVLSKGHASPALYAALALRGFLPR
jgi:transketolase